MRISDWSSDVCSSDLDHIGLHAETIAAGKTSDDFVDLAHLDRPPVILALKEDDMGRLRTVRVNIIRHQNFEDIFEFDISPAPAREIFCLGFEFDAFGAVRDFPGLLHFSYQGT